MAPSGRSTCDDRATRHVSRATGDAQTKSTRAPCMLVGVGPSTVDATARASRKHHGAGELDGPSSRSSTSATVVGESYPAAARFATSAAKLERYLYRKQVRPQLRPQRGKAASARARDYPAQCPLP